ncbi:MAG: hypothetical protein WCB27_13695 [Thermoguttaceae bacterium]
MSTFDLFSKRQKQLRGEMPDVYTYDTIPQPLKVQIIHICHDAIGSAEEYHNQYSGTREGYRFIVETLRREYGLFVLPGTDAGRRVDCLSEFANFLLQEQEAEKALDAVELSFRFINIATRKTEYLPHLGLSDQQATKRADDAIKELNARFREHGIGHEWHVNFCNFL